MMVLCVNNINFRSQKIISVITRTKIISIIYIFIFYLILLKISTNGPKRINFNNIITLRFKYKVQFIKIYKNYNIETMNTRNINTY